MFIFILLARLGAVVGDVLSGGVVVVVVSGAGLVVSSVLDVVVFVVEGISGSFFISSKELLTQASLQ